MVEAVRVADRDRDLADADRARIAKRRPRQRRAVGGIDAHDGEIGVGVLADEIGAQRSPVGHDSR